TDTITNNNETSTIFKFSTNAAGNITDWGNIYGIDISHYIQSTVQGDGVVSGAAHQAFNRIPGSWSAAVAAVPEPATWTMMLAGFGGLGAALRSKRRRAVAD
ncbi:MAG TPA: PEPxxWA-CTERM sorting domain-containing protein, partial [Phenylobacterium sp.]